MENDTERTYLSWRESALDYRVEMNHLLKDRLTALGTFSADFHHFDHEQLIVAAARLLTTGLHALRCAELYARKNVAPEDDPRLAHLHQTLAFGMRKTTEALVGEDLNNGILDLLGLHYTREWPVDALPYARCGDGTIYSYDCDEGRFFGCRETRIAGEMFHIWFGNPESVRAYLCAVLGTKPETPIEILGNGA